MTRQIHFKGNDFFLSKEDLDEDFAEALDACAQPGPADQAVAVVLARFDITGDVEDCKAYLRGYGAWEDDELQHHDTNLSRLVWLMAGDLSESGEAYFCTY